MARITLEEIAQELSEDNWQVTSDEYVNLDTEMEFRCSEGHPVFSTWKKIRQKRLCPVCEQNKLKNPKTTFTPKEKGKNRVLALDQATHITGWAIFDNKKLTSYGTFETKENDEKHRLHEVNMWLVSMIHNWQPDVVGIEGIQYQQQAGITTFQTLARLQGILMETCLQLETPYKVCSTNTWRAHCGVKGRTRTDKKTSMQLLVKQWFDISVSDDCADAIGIGKYVADQFVTQNEIVNWE